MTGRYYITRHALAAFRARIAPRLSERDARAAIVGELALHVRAAVRQRNGMVRLRCRGGRYEFTALVSGESGGELPAVVTITRGSRGGRNDRVARLRADQPAE